LNGIVGEVDLSFKVEDIELIGSCSNIPFLIPEGFEDTVELANHHVMPNIKLSFLVKERTVDIQLNNESLLGSIIMLSLALHDGIELIDFIYHSDSVSSIGELPWLHNPDIPHGPANGKPVLFISLLFTDDGLTLLMIANEPFILRIFNAFLYVKCQWNHFE
jgi:hypothetical protein